MYQVVTPWQPLAVDWKKQRKSRQQLYKQPLLLCCLCLFGAGLACWPSIHLTPPMVTMQDVVCFWCLMIYILSRIVLLLLCIAVSVATKAGEGRGEDEEGNMLLLSNLLGCTLLLLIGRVYLTFTTPYTMPVVIILGTRLIQKVLLKHHHQQQQLKPCSLWDVGLLVMDAFIVQIVSWGGIQVQWQTDSMVYICNITILFVCAVLGKTVHYAASRTLHPILKF